MSKQTDLLRNTFIISLGKFSSQFVSLALLPLYTVFLLPKEFGVVDLVITYVTLFAPILTLQIEMAAFRFLVEARENELATKETISNITQITLSLMTIFIFAYLLVGQLIDIDYSILVLINICTAMTANLFLQIARGLGENKLFAIASTLTGIMMFIFTVLSVVYLKAGANGALFSLALANLSCSIYLFFRLKLYSQINLKYGTRSLKKKLLSYSLPLVPNGLSWWIINASDRTIISLTLGLAVNGVYAVSNKYAAIFSSIFFIFSMAFTESASVHIDAPDRDEFLSETNAASLKLFGALGLVLIAIAPTVFSLAIGPEFQEATKYIPILIVAAFFNAVVGTYSAIYVAKKMTKQVAATSIAAAVINIVLTVGFIKIIGVWAAALATAAAFLAMSIFRHYDLKKYVTITYENGLIFKIIAAYCLVIGLYYIKSPISVAINILAAVGFAIYFNYSGIAIIKNKVLRLSKKRNNV